GGLLRLLVEALLGRQGRDLPPVAPHRHLGREAREVRVLLARDAFVAQAELPRHHLVARLERLLRLDAERVRPGNGDEDRHHADVDQVAAVAPPVLPDQPPERARRARERKRIPLYPSPAAL